jgi:hypothetical protein
MLYTVLRSGFTTRISRHLPNRHRPSNFMLHLHVKSTRSLIPTAIAVDPTDPPIGIFPIMPTSLPVGSPTLPPVFVDPTDPPVASPGDIPTIPPIAGAPPTAPPVGAPPTAPPAGAPPAIDPPVGAPPATNPPVGGGQ